MEIKKEANKATFKFETKTSGKPVNIIRRLEGHSSIHTMDWLIFQQFVYMKKKKNKR